DRNTHFREAGIRQCVDPPLCQQRAIGIEPGHHADLRCMRDHCREVSVHSRLAAVEVHDSNAVPPQNVQRLFCIGQRHPLSRLGRQPVVGETTKGAARIAGVGDGEVTHSRTSLPQRLPRYLPDRTARRRNLCHGAITFSGLVPSVNPPRPEGVVENRDVVLDVEWISSEPEASQAVNGVVQRGAKLLIPVGSTASVAAKRRTSTIPIVFISVGNPVGMGLVESLSHPNSNATGFSNVLGSLSGKYLELARELTKSNGPIDYLWHTGWPDGQPRLQATERAAQSLGVRLRSRGI